MVAGLLASAAAAQTTDGATGGATDPNAIQMEPLQLVPGQLPPTGTEQQAPITQAPITQAPIAPSTAPGANFPGQVQTQSQTQDVADAKGAVLRWLDKVSGTTVDLDLKNGESKTEGRLTIALGDCRYPVTDPASNAYAFLTIHDKLVTDPIFQGWMIASSPALNALDQRATMSGCCAAPCPETEGRGRARRIRPPGQRAGEPSAIVGAADLDGPEACQMRRQELRVEQPEAAPAMPSTR